MAKPEKNADAEDQEGAPEGEVQTEGGKKGFIKKLLGNKKLLMIVGGGLLLLLIGVGAGLYFFVFSGHGEPAKTAANGPEFRPRRRRSPIATWTR
jgi:flagellar FliL protein